MSDGEVAYHLLVRPEEVPVAERALRLLISDEAHQQQIRQLARNVLARLGPADATDAGSSVPLSAAEMKITHTALRLLLNDSGHGEAAEREILHGLLDKLPDEHAIRAIELD